MLHLHAGSGTKAKQRINQQAIPVHFSFNKQFIFRVIWFQLDFCWEQQACCYTMIKTQSVIKCTNSTHSTRVRHVFTGHKRGWISYNIKTMAYTNPWVLHMEPVNDVGFNKLIISFHKQFSKILELGTVFSKYSTKRQYVNFMSYYIKQEYCVVMYIEASNKLSVMRQNLIHLFHQIPWSLFHVYLLSIFFFFF